MFSPRSVVTVLCSARLCALRPPPSFSERLRIRRLATLNTSEPDSSPLLAAQTNRAEVTLKRFWKKVDVAAIDDSLVVTLDGRTLKTPQGNLMAIPKDRRLLALLIAVEWDTQDAMLKHHALPVTSLTARAIDGLASAKTRTEVEANLIRYFETDTICFHESHPPALVELQKEHWDPVLEWARGTYNIEIRTTEDLTLHQPDETTTALKESLSSMDVWELTAMERTTHATKSFLIGLALVKGYLSAEAASVAARVEVLSQIRRWGEVEDSHDVDQQDIRRQLGSAASLLAISFRST